MIDIGPLRPGDRAAWEVLARGYKDFYETVVPDEGYEETWRRLLNGTELHGIGAWVDGRLVGIAHYLFHAMFWTGDACYLQDLFVDEAARGRGAARALIERVAGEARERGATRLYWTTKQDNATARTLYDKVARFNGFIRYDRPLDPERGRPWSGARRVTTVVIRARWPPSRPRAALRGPYSGGAERLADPAGQVHDGRPGLGERRDLGLAAAASAADDRAGVAHPAVRAARCGRR